MTHTIIPETIRFTKLNRKGAYANISSVAVCTHGSLLFLCENEVGSTIYKARLHNPVQDIQKISEGCKGDRILYQNGLVYCYGSSSVYVYPVDKKFNPNFTVNAIKTKKDAVEKLTLVNLSHEGTLVNCKERLKKHQKIVAKKYKQLKCEENEILFNEGEDAFCDFKAVAIALIDSKTMYVAFSQKRCISRCSLKFNSVGLEADCRNLFIEYIENWKYVYEIEVMCGKLVVSHNEGVSLVNQDSKSVVQILTNYHPKSIASYKDGFLFTSNQCLYYWKGTGIETFAGKEGEEGSRDGTTSYCRFYEASGVAVEFDHVIYCADKRVGSIKMITELKETSKFLNALQLVIDAFSVHEKHQKYTLKSLDDAITLVDRCHEILLKNIQHIRSTTNVQKTLNGPEGSVSAATIESIKILRWGLKRLQTNVQTYDYEAINLLSCMTLTVENLHSTVNKKQGTQTLTQYAQ